MKSSLTQGALITVRASGDARVTPEIASTFLGVVSEAASPSEAIEQNAIQMNALVEALHGAGVAANDVRTTGLSLNAQYTHKTDQPAQLRGYQVRNNVIVLVRDLKSLGAVLRAAVSAGANQVGNLKLMANDPRPAQDKARAAAIKALMAKGESFATNMGRKVKRLKSIKESPEPGERMIGEVARGPDGISSGELTVQITVEGVFELE